MVGHIIYLNGTSSAGKSSLARALQNLLPAPYLRLGLDHINDAFPERFLAVQSFGEAPPPEARQGFVVRREMREDGLHLDTQIGPVGRRFITGFRHSIRAFALTGNNVIVDDVLFEQDLLDECVAVMAGLAVSFIKMYCPLAELERRERERGNRLPGAATWQLARMDAALVYDLVVDTSRHTPEECAQHVAQAVANPPTPSAFDRMRQFTPHDSADS